MAQSFDVIVIGSGPGGYVAAIRAAQLGKKVAIIERESLGGICLNWGCIPTKALLKSAQVYENFQHAKDYGILVDKFSADFPAVVKRSRDIADGMSKGVQFLMKKNKIEVIYGSAKVKAAQKLELTAADGTVRELTATHIILATGSRSKELPNLKQDGKKIIGYREAMTLPNQPKSMVIVGSGAIGVEFAYFYKSVGTDVTIVEFMPNIVPREDQEISKELERVFRKKGIKIMTNAAVEKVESNGSTSKVHVKTSNGMEVLDAEMVLSAAGVTPNTENLGLEA